MYEKLNVFYGYDAEGDLECYKLEMKNQGVPKDCMIEAFVELVESELREAIQKIAKDFANDWTKFAEATISEGSDFMEEKYGLKKDAVEEEKISGRIEDFLLTPCVSQLLLNEYDKLLDDYLERDRDLLLSSDEDVTEAMLSQKVTPDFIDKL